MLTRNLIAVAKLLAIACQHAMHEERDIVTANLSVRPSVWLSNAGVVSKEIGISSYFFRRSGMDIILVFLSFCTVIKF